MEQPAQFRVLIVEDEIDTAEIQAAELRDQGLLVEIVNNGNDAIPKMKSWLPHVIILDLELPGKNGIEILHDMKMDPALRDLSVIGNSIHMDPKDDMGRRFYDSFVYIRQEEPMFVNKLSPDETMDNNLTALIGIELARKFKMLPKPLAAYLDNFNKKRVAKGAPRVGGDPGNWEVINPAN